MRRSRGQSVLQNRNRIPRCNQLLDQFQHLIILYTIVGKYLACHTGSLFQQAKQYVLRADITVMQ